MIRVIIVDDHPVVRRGLKQIIEEELDMQVVNQAGNAHDAIFVISQTACDAVILDITLPGISGLEVYDQIRAIPQFDNVPIVAVSAMDPSVAHMQIQTRGFAGFIPKPIDSNEFPQQIARILAGETI